MVTSTDLVLTVTKHLRQIGVVGQFVEFFGPGVAALSIADRATIANMCPGRIFFLSYCFLSSATENLRYQKFILKLTDL